MVQTIRGLKTQESSEFERFFELVQRSANDRGKVFFLECEDGRDAVLEGIEVCDLQGWLVPEDEADKFEPVWEDDEVDDEWDDCFCFVKWVVSGGIKVEFEM